MTSSGSSSSRAAALGLLLLLATAGCGTTRRAWRTEDGFVVQRVALLPPGNETGAAVASKELVDRLATALARAGLEVVHGEPVDAFLRENRFRYTGGVSGELATAARRDLAVDAIVVTTLATYAATGTPAIALTSRLVSAEDVPAILWMDGVSVAGDDRPGPFGMGVVSSMSKLERKAVAEIAGSLSAFLQGKGPRATACPVEPRFTPVVAYRDPALRARHAAPLVGVLPFSNDTDRTAAGDLVQLEFTRQLLARGFRVMEPGQLRSTLLGYRIILQGGLSSTAATTLRTLVNADLLLTGTVREYADQEYGKPARVRFTAALLDARTGAAVWSSTSYHDGEDGLILFDLGRVRRAATLACLVVSAAVDALGEGGRPATVKAAVK